MKEFSNKYLELLKGPYSGINLTRILDEDEFYEKQIVDSILPLDFSKIFQKKLEETGVLVDVGFGGGFPLLPISKKISKIKSIGIETRGKKAKVVQEIANSLELANVKTFHLRVEEIEFDLPCVITFKAVGKIQDFLPLLNITSSNVTVFFYKGPSVENEELKYFSNKLSLIWDLVEDIKIPVPGTDERRLLSFCLKDVPRGTVKNLVKLSKIL